MITKYPYKLTPAFNEIFVEDNENTAIEVREVSGKGRRVTLHRIKQNGVARFNLKNFTARLFFDSVTAIASSGRTGWVFFDRRLRADYQVDGVTFTALNAVKDKGRVLDLHDDKGSPALTLRRKVNGRITVPKYAGFPTGMSFVYKNEYRLNFDDATVAEIATTAANTFVRLPWTYVGVSGGFISWGDGTVEAMTAVTATTINWMTHTYATPGTYEIAWVSMGDTVQNLTTHSWSNAGKYDLTSFNTVIRTYLRFSSNVRTFTAYGLTGLTGVYGSLPAGANAPTYVFRDCVNLTYVYSALFSNIRTKVTSLAYAFFNTPKLTSLTTSTISGLTEVTSLTYAFNASGILNFSASMFVNMTKCTNISYAFAYTNITQVPANMLSSMRLLSNADFAFSYCAKLVTVGANVFNSDANCTGVGMFVLCPMLQTIAATALNGLRNATNLNYIFQGDIALAAIPAGLFAGMKGITSLQGGWYGCTSLTGVPDGTFDEMTALNNNGLNDTFNGCTAFNLTNPNIFRYNTTVRNLTRTFANCKAMTSISVTFFRVMPQLLTAESTFADCSITTLPLGMFTTLVDSIRLRHTFAGNPLRGNLPVSSGGLTLLPAKCTDITGLFFRTELTFIPPDILDVFENSTATVIMDEAFAQNEGLTSVPAGLFTRAASKVGGVRRMFASIGSAGAPCQIPAGLFNGVTLPTDIGGLFDTSRLAALPADILHPFVNATTANRCFGGTTINGQFHTGMLQTLQKLTNTSNMFIGTVFTGFTGTLQKAHLTGLSAVTNATEMFSMFSGLTSVASDAFDDMTELVNVSYIFNRCTGLTNVGNVFRRNKKITAFGSAFRLDAPLGALTGTSPVTEEGYKLWERAGKPGYPATVTGTACFRNNYTNLTDAASIPSGWL